MQKKYISIECEDETMTRTQKRRSLASFAGAWSMTDEEAKDIFGEITALWKEYDTELSRQAIKGE